MINANTPLFDTVIYKQELDIFGYVIDRRFYVNLNNGVIVRIADKNGHDFGVLKLRPTMMRLLTYLVLNVNANNSVVTHDDILTNVWENYGLVATNQRMAYVINQLNTKLSELGISEQLIKNIHGQGYGLSHIYVSILYGKSE
ncbi:helix-turn-helix domain-containing protein [Budviciaceae bacterium BWR-B9]|uniref:Helix-turn-helix domain-containing protein n=1 Tax=Limnobaculum allomyrinae TaxID=2791986 RepID=A0ABS1IR16_9GAMM|nr:MULTISPECIES: helix-turn-helix domain-containing protein [Limnobaculum]MBK5144200.1 helix-turn-helix domain-containing protein [Limnobaculum allomyrinae]MBV7692056.1 helix-turn-helix domain-containing protein [Limnobaculum sp. M2-1]